MSGMIIDTSGFESVDESVYPRGIYPWFVVAVLLIVTTLAAIDRQALAILIVPIQQDLGLSDTSMGLLLGPSFTIFHALAALPMGKIADHASRRNLLMAGLVIWSLATLGAGFSDSFEGLFIMRALVGLGESCVIPAAYSLIADYFAPSRRGRAIAITGLGVSFGGGLALIGSGLTLQLMQGFENHPLPIIGAKMAWELVFITFGLAGFVVMALMMMVREPVRRGARLHRDTPRADFFPFLRAHRLPLFLILTAFVSASFVGYLVGAWGPTLLVRRYGLELGYAGQLKGTLTLVSASVGTIVGGFLGDYLTRRHAAGRFLMVLMLTPILLPTLAIICFGTQLWQLILGMIPFFVCAGLIASIAYAALQDIVPLGVRGRTLAFYALVQQLIGIGLGPTVVALVTDNVLRDRSLLHLSILITATPMWLLALLCAGFGVRHFTRMRREVGD